MERNDEINIKIKEKRVFKKKDMHGIQSRTLKDEKTHKNGGKTQLYEKLAMILG